MIKLTMKQRIIRFLLAKGFVLSPVQPSSKYESYHKHITAHGETRTIKYHVGKSGGVRSGTKGITNSISITTRVQSAMKEWENTLP